MQTLAGCRAPVFKVACARDTSDRETAPDSFSPAPPALNQLLHLAIDNGFILDVFAIPHPNLIVNTYCRQWLALLEAKVKPLVRHPENTLFADSTVVNSFTLATFLQEQELQKEFRSRLNLALTIIMISVL